MGIYTLFYGNVKYEFAMRYLGLEIVDRSGISLLERK